MKKYSYTIRRKREADMKVVRFKDEMDALISSEDFITKFRGYIEDIALFKRAKGRKFMRSTDYASVGILDLNDLFQEAYLAFLMAYDNIDWNKVNEVHENERGAVVWSFLKKSTILKFEENVRAIKDGVKVPKREMFLYKDSPIKTGNANYNMVTKLFSQLEKTFSNNEDEVALTKWETDLVGAFLEVHMDEFLDLTRDGNRDFKKNEREVMKALYGIDQPKKTYKELSDFYGIGQSTIRKVKERALKRLQDEESKQKIAEFLHEYRINTKADTEKFKK